LVLQYVFSWFEVREHINNYHQIINNHFGPRPRKQWTTWETPNWDSETSTTPLYTNKSYIIILALDRCNGEVEVISSKSNFNQFRNNIFLKEGSWFYAMEIMLWLIVTFLGNDNSTKWEGIINNTSGTGLPTITLASDQRRII
jgi:poly(beta-D-mannuronate) lyase